MNDEIINPMGAMNMECIKPMEILSNGEFMLNQLYTDIDFNYFDIQANQRGEGGFLFTQADGAYTLLHLKTAGINSSNDFDFDAFTWSGNNLASI